MNFIVNAIVQPYCLALRQPWQTATGVITKRQGWLIKIITAEGQIGWGDCAPMPIAETETETVAQAALTTLVPQLIGQTISASWPISALGNAPPSVNFAIETALTDIQAQIAGVSLSQWLNPIAKNTVPVNAAIGIADENLIAKAQVAITAGYTVLKIKLGLKPWPIELEYLRALTNVLPAAIQLRLDANQAWSKFEATAMLQHLVALPIEAVEEPLAGANFYVLNQLQNQVPFSLALDESLISMPTALWLQHYPVRRLILKPCVLGGLNRTWVLAKKAQEYDIEWVITSCLESSIGIRAAAHLAAALGTELAQGLATGSWFIQDVVATLPIENGMAWLDRLSPITL